MTFKSKKDLFFKTIINSLILLLILIGINVLNVSDFTSENIIGLVIITLVLILLLWIYYGTYYEIEKNYI
jgi:ribose/xylose/arabinose/galactoside ABC-type transport system permease subunit